MIKYTLPALKKPKKEPNIVSSEVPIYPDKWDRTIRIPLSKEQIKTLDIGAEVEICIYGKISELQNVEVENGRNRISVELELTTVELAAENEFDKLLDEDE